MKENSPNCTPFSTPRLGLAVTGYLPRPVLFPSSISHKASSDTRTLRCHACRAATSAQLHTRHRSPEITQLHVCLLCLQSQLQRKPQRSPRTVKGYFEVAKRPAGSSSERDQVCATTQAGQMAFMQPSVPAVCEICSEAQQSTRNVVCRLRTAFQTCTKTMLESDASNHHYTYVAAHPDRRKLESLPRLRAWRADRHGAGRPLFARRRGCLLPTRVPY